MKKLLLALGTIMMMSAGAFAQEAAESGAEIEFEKEQKEMEENSEESKLHEPTMKEMNSLRKDINKMTHRDRILMVNKILEKVGTKTLFVYEEPNYYVEKVAQELLED